MIQSTDEIKGSRRCLVIVAIVDMPEMPGRIHSVEAEKDSQASKVTL